MAELGIGIIGSGFMGRTFAECLKKYTRGARLVAVAGGTRAPALAAEFGVEAAPDLAALLGRPGLDAVIVATPHADHRDQTVAAARAGKHVFVEKPMETTAARCDAMIDACRRAGVVLAVAHVVRFRGAGRKAKEIVDRGEIGEVRFIHQHWTYAGDPTAPKGWTLDPVHGGLVLDAGSHMMDLMRWYAGAEPTRVYGVVGKLGAGPWVNPTAAITVSFANGVLGNYWMNYETPAPGFKGPNMWTQIAGTRGMISSDAFGKIEKSVGGRDWELVWEQPHIDFTHTYLNPVRLEAFSAELQDFLDAIREGRRPEATGEDGRAAVEIIEAATISSRTGQAVALPLTR